MRKSGIYQIRNIKNNRIYIGSAVNLSNRKKHHFRALEGRYHRNKFFERDYHKCGKKYFKFFILEYCETKNLLKLEQQYLDVLWDKQNNCYNICPVAGNSLGKKVSNETKRKQSLLKKGKKLTKEHKQNISKNNAKYWLGKKRDKETSRKISESKLGEKNYKYDHSIYHFINEKLNLIERCTQYCLRNKYNLNRAHISSVVGGKRKSHKGWKII